MDFASDTCVRTEISESNHGLLQGLESRRHEIEKIYVCSDLADDLMLIGRVFWTFKDGQKRNAGFAARAVIEESGHGTRLKLYQGWTVMRSPRGLNLMLTADRTFRN